MPGTDLVHDFAYTAGGMSSWMPASNSHLALRVWKAGNPLFLKMMISENEFTIRFWEKGPVLKRPHLLYILSSFSTSSCMRLDLLHTCTPPVMQPGCHLQTCPGRATTTTMRSSLRSRVLIWSRSMEDPKMGGRFQHSLFWNDAMVEPVELWFRHQGPS